MYFTKIRLKGLNSVDLPIVDALPSDRYILKNASGLGPPEVDVSVVNTLNAGAFYQGRRPQPREVVIHVGLNPNYNSNQTVSQLREVLYGLLTPGTVDEVRIEIMEESTVLFYTLGHVKNLEIAPFTATPEVQITIACHQQYLEATSDLYIDPGPLDFPTIDNIGTAPAGFRMEVVFTSPTNVWSISDDIGRTMKFDYSFTTGDILTIDTRPGYRGIWRTRSGFTLSIIYSLSVESTWHMLHGGDNLFATNLQNFTWGDVFYRPSYWGI